MSEEKRFCSQCGALLSGHRLEGNCPHCLARLAMGLPPEPLPAAGAPQQQLLKSTQIRYIGDYELREEIARGGMGVVYRAQQVTLKRDVAVKLLLFGPFASDIFVRRFRREAEAAAALRHPNIVTIFEVGVHEEQPYFSMELVEGPSLAAVARDKVIAPRQAVLWVKTIAEALQYAHNQGVLHRDLKPSNILIDPFNQPKITDFGLAKRLDDEGDLTATGQVLGTPNYIPPEQAGGGPGRADITSDIYSLGAILYHLLTGRPPFATESVQETLHQVLHKEPVSPQLLNAAVPPDLDTICLKCLSKEPARRYTSAQALADDLGRWLDGRPILARPISNAERFTRWCRRHPAIAGLSSALILLLLAIAIGSSIALYQINRARKEAMQAQKRAETGEQQALQAAVKSSQVAGFLQDMLSGVGPSVANGRDTTVLQEIMARMEERMATDLTNHPDVEIELQQTLGNVYLDIGRFDKAEELQRRALALARKVNGETNMVVSAGLYNIGSILARQPDRLLDAENILREGLAITRATLTNRLIEGRFLETLSHAMMLGTNGVQAEALAREAMAIYKETAGEESPEYRGSLTSLANTLEVQNKLSEAEPLYREALERNRKLHGDVHPAVATCLHNLANLLRKQKKLEDAEKMQRESLAMRRKLLGNLHPSTEGSLSALAGILKSRQADPAETSVLYRELADLRGQLFGKDHPDVAKALDNLGWDLLSLRKFGEGAEAYKQALEIRRKAFGPGSKIVGITMERLAQALDRNGDLAPAEKISREALTLFRALPDASTDSVQEWVAGSLHHLADVLRKQGQVDSARAYAEESVLMYQTNSYFTPDEKVHAFHVLSLVMAGQGENALPRLKQLCGSDQRFLMSAAGSIARDLVISRNFSAAEPFARESLALREKNMPDDWRFFSSKVILGAVLAGLNRPDQAEPLLVSGYEGMKQREASIPITMKYHFEEAAEHLAVFYDQSNRTEDAARVRNRGK